VRGTSREKPGVARINQAGLEGCLADPDRPGTILELVGDVAVVVWLLGWARGEPEALEAIHGPRLERLLEKLVDTPVRGFAYEAGGNAPPGALRAGRRAVERAGETWRIPVTVLEGDREAPGWAGEVAARIAVLLG
jgi:hypothetical protein